MNSINAKFRNSDFRHSILFTDNIFIVFKHFQFKNWQKGKFTYAADD